MKKAEATIISVKKREIELCQSDYPYLNLLYTHLTLLYLVINENTQNKYLFPQGQYTNVNNWQ